jgi:hypothetical protein
MTVARRCALSRNLEHEEAKARYRAVEIQPQWVVTAGKQTTTTNNKPASKTFDHARIEFLEATILYCT